MCVSLKTVFLLSILIINVQQLESAKLHIRNEPTSGKILASLCSQWYGKVDNIAFLAKQLDPLSVFAIAEQSTNDIYDILEKRLMQEVEKKILHGYDINYDKVNFYQHVYGKNKKKDKKTGKDKPIIVTESAKPTTPVYVPKTTAKYIAHVTRPYSTKTTTVKYIKEYVPTTPLYVPPETEKPTTTTMMPYMPEPASYDSSVNIPNVPEGRLSADNYYPNPEEEEEDED